MTKNDVPREKVLDFKVVRDPLDEALDALKNFIDREWPKQLENIAGARALFLTMIKVAINTYQSVRFLAADLPKEEAPPLEFALSIPPLTRSLLDQLFTVIFLSEDLAGRTEWYYKGGWREVKEMYDRYKAEYGDRGEWADWFKGYGENIESTRVEWGVSEEEAADLTKIQYWPIPSQMMRHRGIKEQTRAFLEYLDAWFYRTLSQAAHLSFPGLAHRGAPLLLKPGDERDARLTKRKSQAVFTTITIVLALASEMENLLQFGLRERLAFVWGVLVKYWEEAGDLYRMRYAEFLTGQGEGIVEGRHRTTL